MTVSSYLFFKTLGFSLWTSSNIISLYITSNGSIKSAYSISVGRRENCKPLDKRDSSCLVRLYLEKLKITILGSQATLLMLFAKASSFLLSTVWWERKDFSFFH